MIALVALAYMLAVSLAVSWVVKVNDQMMRDSRRKSYRIDFPADLDPERVTAWLRSISGTLRVTGLAKWFGGSPSIVLEVWATNQGIKHYIKVPWQYEPYIRPKLESLIPGIRLTLQNEVPRCVWVYAVEAGLKASHRPLNIKDASDFSTTILNNFSALDEGETLMMQWVIAPAVPEHKPIYGDAPSKEQSIASVLFGSTATRDEIQERREKLDEPNMLGVLRVGAVANTQTRAHYMVRGVMSTLDSARGPSTHFYKRIVTAGVLQERIDRAALPLVQPAQLNTPELAAVIGWPLGNPMIAGLPSAPSRYIPAPDAVPRVGRVLGQSTYPGRERPVALPYSEAVKHAYYSGTTGSGKTTALSNNIYQDMRNGNGVIVIENKGDLFNNALNLVPPNRINDTIVLDVNDGSYPIGLNILQQGDPAVVVDELLFIFNSLFEDRPSMWMQQLMYNGLHTLAQSKTGTFMDLYALFLPKPEEEDWSYNLKQSVSDPEIREFWERYRTDPKREQKLDPLLSRLWPIMRSKLINIFGQSKSGFSMADVIRNNKNLLINLSGLESMSATLAGTMFTNLIWQTVKANPVTNPNFLYIDEFQTFLKLPVDPEDMLAKSRSFGLGMVLANQHLGQLTDSMRDAIMTNAATKVIFQTGDPTDARRLAQSFGPLVTPDDFMHLGKYEALSRVATPEGISQPFTLTTLPPVQVASVADKVRYASRANYGTRADDVHAERTARRTTGVPRRGRQKPASEEWGSL